MKSCKPIKKEENFAKALDKSDGVSVIKVRGKNLWKRKRLAENS